MSSSQTTGNVRRIVFGISDQVISEFFFGEDWEEISSDHVIEFLAFNSSKGSIDFVEMGCANVLRTSSLMNVIASSCLTGYFLSESQLRFIRQQCSSIRIVNRRSDK